VSDFITSIIVYAIGISHGWLISWILRNESQYEECRRMLAEAEGQCKMMKAMLGRKEDGK
jgi:hypothetical protein